MATTVRKLLCLGKFRREDRLALAEAGRQAAFDAEFADAGRESIKLLDAHGADAVTVDDSDSARDLCLDARARLQHAQIPILSIRQDLDDLSFADVFSWGGDDALELGETHALVARLRGLPATPPAPPAQGRGAALIVDGDRTRRTVLGRVLRNAGYSIDFAVDADEARGRVKQHGPKLVVASSDVGGSPVSLLETARAEGSVATWIVTCPPKDLSASRAPIEALGNATVTDGFAPAENVVFLVNELERGGAQDKRSSRRLLYGTTVAFRGAGRDHDDHGFSYNVSLGGLYVRTLAPPEDDVVWIELRPPRCERRIRLEGRIVWRRKFGPSGAATVPPGFGVALLDASKRDLAAWQEGYSVFATALGFPV